VHELLSSPLTSPFSSPLRRCLSPQLHTVAEFKVPSSLRMQVNSENDATLAKVVSNAHHPPLSRRHKIRACPIRLAAGIMCLGPIIEYKAGSRYHVHQARTRVRATNTRHVSREHAMFILEDQDFRRHL
jgi:hypothetical protein